MTGRATSAGGDSEGEDSKTGGGGGGGCGRAARRDDRRPTTPLGPSSEAARPDKGPLRLFQTHVPSRHHRLAPQTLEQGCPDTEQSAISISTRSSPMPTMDTIRIHTVEDIDESDRKQLDASYAVILDVLGPPQGSNNPFSQREIKDALWDAYFDTETVLDGLMKEAEKRNRKKQDQMLAHDAKETDASSVREDLSRLSLDAGAVTGRGGGMAGLVSRGRGGRGGGGRAGLAKRNLASLAPGGLPGVAVSQQRAFGPAAGDVGTRSPANAAGMSKLAKMAQMRQPQRTQLSSTVPTSRMSHEASAVPPLSPSKRLSEGPADPETAKAGASSPVARPSKLLALAQGRRAHQPESAGPTPSPAAVDSSAAARAEPQLSKLQQRALAAKLQRAAREEANPPAPAPIMTGGAQSGQETIDPTSSSSQGSMQGGLDRVLPGGIVESALFPAHGEASSTGRSDVGEILAQSTSGHLPANAKKSGASTPAKGGKSIGSSSAASAASVSQVTTPRDERNFVLGAPAVAKLSAGIGKLHVDDETSAEPLPKPANHAKILEEWRQRQTASDAKKEISIVVVGHVDAGKSTLMGRVLHDVGSLSDREHSSHERASAKIGKGSFAYAWALDASEEERERGVTISTAHATFTLPHRNYTVLDAPGHRDFVPSMITGAAQADAAILVIDATKGAFEAGFGPKGQTREHAVLIRALGVRDLVVAVNKLDTVNYEQARFEEILAQMQPFLASTGFDTGRIAFVPLGAAAGENVSRRAAGSALSSWYSGPTLLDVLDSLDPPVRDVDAPLRMPLTNVFRGQTAVSSGVAAAGRVLSGLVAVGDRLRVVPGDETATVRAIEQDGESVPWSVAGGSVTVYLAGIDEIHLAVGSILCPPTQPIALSTSLLVQLLVFDPTYPILAGSMASLHHHSLDVPCTVTELVSSIDKADSGQSGAAKKRKPRVLGKGATAMVRLTVQSPGLPVEVARKDLARVLLRMHGETVAAGMVTECS
ncbi:unnamed protein product [Parajaminaea phylloscopi]